MTHYIYSGERLADSFAKGGKQKNPIHYIKPLDGASKVTVVGNHPKIVKDYQAAGVEVFVAGDGNATPIAAAPLGNKVAAPKEKAPDKSK